MLFASPLFIWIACVAITYCAGLITQFATWTVVSLIALSAIAGIGLLAVGSVLRPEDYVPRSVLARELSKLGGLVRGGLGTFVVAVVGALGTLAVQADLRADSPRSQILWLLSGVLLCVIVVALARLMFGIAFRFHVADRGNRRRAIRNLVVSIAFRVGGRRFAARSGSSWLVRDLNEDLAGPGPFWFAAVAGWVGMSVTSAAVVNELAAMDF
ncbi:hypothetical protein [Protaetiibacter intestinalis]|uniref:Uncharacterized protein n=1 Tax=Protaetiibacter intestinalis TaxID=2419774 RepID=A0A387B445_9MICO|nr:hypothetical protein [Protaetiibacter intestinalis]AYF97183.1 hypothetical protein D7I47_02255 [Protaetiibacter intestinalis]